MNIVLNKIIEIVNDPSENENNNQKYKLILVKICIMLDRKISLYLQSEEKVKNEIYKNILMIILFLYIVIYNIKNAEKIILLLTINSSDFCKIMKKLLKIAKENDDYLKNDYNRITIANFLLNICFDDLKDKIYSYKNQELIEIYQKEIYSDFLEIFPSTNKRFHFNKKYMNFLQNIIDLNLDIYIKHLKKENSDIFCRNLIPILLSHPGFDFVSFYIYIVNKHIEIIRKEYNTELTSLFRADDFTNDLIKNLIILFCNESFMISFFLSLPKEYLSTNDIEFDLDIFENFLHKFIEKLADTLPFIIRVLLKIIFTCLENQNKKEENYNVLYTVLIFNFFIAPITLDLFGLSIVKYKSMRQLSRILRNVFFGKEFDNHDKLSYFNKKVDTFHKFINDKFKHLLDAIDIEKDKNDINKQINNILIHTQDIKDKITEGKNNTIFLPSFCYQYFWENVSNAIKCMTKEKK
jgi:hypothetical protein